MNAALSYENKNPREYISLVPTSAHSGDGMGSLIALICELTQTLLAKKLAYSDELQATVMEVGLLSNYPCQYYLILIKILTCPSVLQFFCCICFLTSMLLILCIISL